MHSQGHSAHGHCGPGHHGWGEREGRRAAFGPFGPPFGGGGGPFGATAAGGAADRAAGPGAATYARRSWRCSRTVRCTDTR